ncbi:MAG TPA: DoxX family protein, partial [Ferruginibacter sp.]|nr:DoxX family protein [Ferruginibacter sp.]
AHLGYPAYLMTLLGILKILGVIVVTIPGLPRLKEWAYAGFFFSMAGAIFSHLAINDPAKDIFGPLLLLVLTLLSWHFRPAGRKTILAIR